MIQIIIEITEDDMKCNSRWVAQWPSEISGKKQKKSFAVKKYGYHEAFNKACEHREKMMNKVEDFIHESKEDNDSNPLLDDKSKQNINIKNRNMDTNSSLISSEIKRN